MKRLIILILFGILTAQIHAQSEVDALRYSFLTHGGTARYVGMSGAFGALGADFSSMSTNPAGLGTFRSNSFMFSPIFDVSTVETEYLGETTNVEKAYVNLNNLGFVVNLKSPEDEPDGWQSVGFAFGYNKLKTFNNDITLKAYNDLSSRLDQFMLNADGIYPEDLNTKEWMAYDTYLIDTLANSNLYYIHPYYGNIPKNQEKRVVTTGSVGEYVCALGANYNDVFQIGIAVGFPYINYKEVSTFTEKSDITDLESFTYTENLSTKGNGFNVKLGFIYRPIDFLRIGAAFHSKTFYTLKDIYSYEISSHFRTPDSYNQYDYSSNGDGEMEYSYELTTPMRLILSAAFVFSKIGILSADYEYIRYDKARLRADDDDFDDVNNTISDIYKAGHNLRLGGEIKLSPVYLRGGVSYYSSPDKDNGNTIGELKSYSFGAGIRTKNVFVDFGFNHSYQVQNTRLYDFEVDNEIYSEYAKYKFTDDLICLTIGFVF